MPYSQILNTGYIYFDFNEAVVTNQVLNTIEAPNGIKDETINNHRAIVYPNPTSQNATIEIESTKTENTTISVLDIQGRVLLKTSQTCNIGNNKFNLSLTELAAGVYTIHIENTNTTILKLIKTTR
jgi:hypothetical protein